MGGENFSEQSLSACAAFTGEPSGKVVIVGYDCRVLKDGEKAFGADLTKDLLRLSPPAGRVPRPGRMAPDRARVRVHNA